MRTNLIFSPYACFLDFSLDFGVHVDHANLVSISKRTCFDGKATALAELNLASSTYPSTYQPQDSSKASPDLTLFVVLTSYFFAGLFPLVCSTFDHYFASKKVHGTRAQIAQLHEEFTQPNKIETNVLSISDAWSQGSLQTSLISQHNLPNTIISKLHHLLLHKFRFKSEN
ncbi:hypothetical protein DFH28DRAFT_946169 [Melampsora americana]|nr:hypothetical protein DFH28DRAFT_946169 [Melampsora americana]